MQLTFKNIYYTAQHSGKKFKILAHKKNLFLKFSDRAAKIQFLQSESQENLFLGLIGCEINFISDFQNFKTCDF